MTCCHNVLTAQSANPDSMGSWTNLGGEPINIPYPTFNADTLEGCELQYKALDLRHHILRKFNVKADAFNEKDKLCDEINKILISHKDKYLMKCRQCGKKLEFSQKVGLCDKCYQALADERSKLREAKRKEKQRKKNKYSYHSNLI